MIFSMYIVTIHHLSLKDLAWTVFEKKATLRVLLFFSNKETCQLYQQTKGRNNSAQQTRHTTTKTWTTYSNFTWHASKYKVYKLHQRYIEVIPVVEFIYLVFTRMPGGVTVGNSGLCCVPCLSSALMSLCWFYTSALGLILFQIMSVISLEHVRKSKLRVFLWSTWHKINNRTKFQLNLIGA